MGTLWKLTGFVVCVVVAVVVVQFVAQHEVAQAAPASDDVVVELRAVREAAAAYKARDVDAVMKTYSAKANAVFMGTGPGEIWVGPEEIRAAHVEIFKGYDDETAEVTWVSACVKGDVAWVMATVDITSTSGDEKYTFPVNQSIVLEKEGGKWVIVALHYSNLTAAE